MSRITYTLFRTSKRTKKKVKMAAIILSIPIAGPFIVAWFQSYFISEPVWFNRFFNLDVAENGLVAGPYLIFAGILLFLIGILVGDKTMEYGGDTNYGEGYKQATSSFGFVSQIMLVCQTGAFFIAAWGVIVFFSAW